MVYRSEAATSSVIDAPTGPDSSYVVAFAERQARPPRRDRADGVATVLSLCTDLVVLNDAIGLSRTIEDELVRNRTEGILRAAFCQLAISRLVTDVAASDDP